MACHPESAHPEQVPWGVSESDYSRARMTVSATTGLLLVVALWFGLVLGDRLDTEPRVAAFWWIMPVVALVLGAVFGTGYGSISGLVLGCAQFILAFVTGPRGDNDGLWFIWIPTTFLAMLLYAFLAEGAGRLRGWIDEARSEGPSDHSA